MPRPAADRVRVTWLGTGTSSPITLAGVAPGVFQAVPSTLDGRVVRYLIEHETALEAEAGYGTYTHSGTTLTRTFQTFPTFGGSPVSFSSGIKFVQLTDIHLDLVPHEDTVDPTVNDDISIGFLRGHIWLNTSAGTAWICIAHTDGAAVWARIDGAGVTLDQHDILGRILSGSGAAAALAAGDLTEETTPEAGDFLLGWSGGSLLRKFDVGDLPSTADAAPSPVTSNAATFSLTDAARLHNNVIVTSHQAGVAFEVPAAATANSEWRIMPRHDGCTVTIPGGSPSGTITPNPARIVNGGLVIVTVTGNGGSAPVVEVRGNVVVPATSVSTKTYDADDDGQDFLATGTQTFGAAANFPAGFYVNIFNGSGSSITIDGLDADHTLPARGVVLVKKLGTALIAVGSGSTGGEGTVLDAA